LQAFDRHVSFRLQDAIDLRAAGVHALGQRGLGQALPRHLLAQRPRDD
jgi:hypothetical protein